MDKNKAPRLLRTVRGDDRKASSDMTDSTQQQPVPAIPAEAVEAAAIAMSECGAEGWEDQGAHFQGVMRREARLALEAAAPYMQGTVKPEKEISTGALIRQLLDETKADGS